MMNYNRIKTLLQYSVSMTNAYSRKVLIRNVIFKKRAEIHLSFARICCTNTNTSNSQQHESNDEPDMLEFEFDLPQYTNIDHEALTGNDPEKIKKLEVIQQEIELHSQKARLIPTKLKLKHWQKLLSLVSKSKRKRYLNYLWGTEKRNEDLQLRKDESRKRLLLIKETQKLEPTPEIETNSPLQYGLTRNTLFQRIYSSHINSFYNWKLLQTSVYGSDLVVDCQFEGLMNDREFTMCVAQLVRMWGLNRDSFNPFNIIFCNFNRNGQLAKLMEKQLPLIFESGFPFTYTEKSYLDLFPKKKLIYLTPHCHNLMKKYEPDKVYIIGGVTDVGETDPVTLTKAKEDGLRMAKFPLDKYIDWIIGRKSLAIHKCVGILSDLKDGKDWNFAFRYVKKPIMDESPPEAEKQFKRYKIRRIQEEYGLHSCGKKK